MSIDPLPTDMETVVVLLPNTGSLLYVHCQDVVHVSHELSALFMIRFGPGGCIRYKEAEPFTYMTPLLVYGGRGRILLGGQGVSSWTFSLVFLMEQISQ